MHLVSRFKYQDNGKDKWVIWQLPVSLLREEHSVLKFGMGGEVKQFKPLIAVRT
jgi:hypothetical protein